MEQFFGVKNKNEYQNLEMQRFIQRHGLDKFQMNPHFPVISLQIIRGAVAADMDGYLEDYIDKVLTRITFWGAMYVAAVCLLPEIFRMFYPSMPFNFGGTSLLILVVVTMDFMSQMQAHAMSHQYDGMMKKANLRNYKR